MIRPAAALTALLLLTAAPAAAHPHVWVDYQLTARMTANGVSALEQEWSFDEDFSASVLSDVLKRKGPQALKDGAFTPGEEARLKELAFSNLKNFGYFAHVWLAGKPVALAKEATGFHARLESSHLIYSFTLALTAPADPRQGPLLVGIWDDSYYVDVGPAKGKKPSLQGPGADACGAVIAEDKSHPIYYGSIFPPVVKISC